MDNISGRPSARETFADSKLNWEEIDLPPHSEILEWHRQLLRFRMSESELTDRSMDRIRTLFSEEASWLVIERGPITVAVNSGGVPQCVPVSDLNRLARHVISSDAAVSVCESGLDMPPQSVAIFHTVAEPAVFPQSLDLDIYQAMAEQVILRRRLDG